MSTPGANDNTRLDDISRPHSARPDNQDAGTPTAEVTTEAQDRELKEVRQLAQEYAHLDLEQLAPIARSEEGGAQADRYRSMFGYQWLSKACGECLQSARAIIG